MPSLAHAVLCALLATTFWSLLGYALGRHLLPRVLAISLAPVLGWAVYCAVTLPLFELIGFSGIDVIGVGACTVLLGGGSLALRVNKGEADREIVIPAWIFAAAAALALIPAAAIVPKISAGSVQLAVPMFDHAKVAMIDAMARLGVPAVNPTFGEYGAAGRLAYYYLWHFSAAQLALALSATGWEADIGTTWFTAFASLALMMGVAAWLSKRPAAALWAVILAAAGSLWSTLGWIFGSLDRVLLPPIGMAGWLYQVTWVPQHLMSASCVIAAMLLVARYAQRQNLATLLTLVPLVVAGFESSAFVGGVTFAIAVLLGGPILLATAEPERRFRLAAALAIGAVFALCLAAPFVRDQLAAVAARGGGSPIVIEHLEVLGDAFPPLLRRLLDIPAYWLILLPCELPATYAAGVLALFAIRRRAAPGPETFTLALFAALAAAGLGSSWLLVSTLGGNNDLGLRAILPPAMILIIAAAAGLMLIPRRTTIVAAALGGLALSLPGSAQIVRDNLVGRAAPDGAIFAATPQLWRAVRRHAAPAARVANNPRFLEDLTEWPVNISWALLADRSSCFAGREMAYVYAPLSPARTEAIEAEFVRVFNGEGTAQDVGELARKYDCATVVVTAQDKAWGSDPFASSADYRLAEARAGQWRIYVRR